MIKNVIFYIFLLILANSCATKVEKRGYMFELVDAHLLTEGLTSRDEALKIMGFPTIISGFNEESWIYYSENKEGFLFFKPNVTSRDVLVLRFDDNNIIKNIEKISLADENKNLEFALDYTNVETKKVNALKSIFSNVGQIKAQ